MRITKNYGTVNYEGIEYILNQNPYKDNYMDGVAFFAHAVKCEDNKVDLELDDADDYMVRWDTTEAYDKNDEMYNKASYLRSEASHRDLTGQEQKELDEAEQYPCNDDDGDACDWDNPASINQD